MSDSKPKVVITHWVHREVIDYLSPRCELVLNQGRESLDSAELLRRAAGARGLMMFMPDQVDEAFLQCCPQLEVIAGVLKGYDNFDVTACSRHGVWFTIERDGLTVPTAELTIALMLGIGRHIGSSDRQLRRGDFPGWRPIWYGTGLAGSVVGFLGMGAVGQAIARRLRSWDCQLLYHDLNRLDEPVERTLGVRFESLDEVIASADFLVPMLPYTAATHRLLDEDRLATMKRGACLINTSRGSVVDELAVAKLLAAGHLAGYAADVFAFEDWARPDRPKWIPPELLAQEEKTLFTQHLGSAVDRVRREIALSAARKIVQVLDGEIPDGAVNRPQFGE